MKEYSIYGDIAFLKMSMNTWREESYNKIYSVTSKIKVTKQPKGGYLNPKEMTTTYLGKKDLENFKSIINMNQEELEQIEPENYNPTIVGTAVDYLTRFMMTKDATQSFSISLKGARNLGLTQKALEYISYIKGIDNRSIFCALKLAEFDVAFRNIPSLYKTNKKEPNQNTFNNIKKMINNSLKFFKIYGRITKNGFTFKKNWNNNGYSKVVVSGDGDFLTKDTLWDFKVSINPPTKDHTLQILMYYLMGKKSKLYYFDNIKYVGIYNPRLNIVYRYKVSNINIEILKEIAKNVIEYNDISFLERVDNEKIHNN